MRLAALPPGRRSRAAAPGGRLDRWIGTSMAETVRAAMGVGFKHRTAGGEWPHTAARNADERRLLQAARELDTAPQAPQRAAAPEPREGCV
jgi:hypothetical protein